MVPAPFHSLLARRPLRDEFLVNAYAYAGAARAVRQFHRMLKFWPNAALPVTYNEKMLWRRIFDHDPAFQVHCDKLSAKTLFEGLADPVETPKVLWTGSDPKDFPDELMRPGVLAKMNAGSRQNWFFSSQGSDRAAFEATCREWLARPFGAKHAEWAYRGIPRLIFAEEEVVGDRHGIDELKVHLFGGEAYYTVIYRDEKTPVSKSAIYDAEGRRLEVVTTNAFRDPTRRLPPDHRVPDSYFRAIRAAEAIAAGTDYLRVDFMVSQGRLYGGEVTPYPTAGHMTNSDREIMNDMARRWDMRRSWFLRTPQRGLLAGYQKRLAAFVEAEQTAYAAAEAQAPESRAGA